MKEKLFREILMKSPFGYAYHKLLMGSKGEPEDCIFSGYKTAFEKMIG